jgi:hypothetical protein
MLKIAPRPRSKFLFPQLYEKLKNHAKKPKEFKNDIVNSTKSEPIKNPLIRLC